MPRKRTTWVLFSRTLPEIKCERNRPTSFVQRPMLDIWIVYIHSVQVLLQEKLDQMLVVDLTWRQSQVLQHLRWCALYVDAPYGKLLAFVNVDIE